MEENKKILIVEDDKDFMFILKTSLGEAGFTVVSASDGEEGITLAKKENPDLIIIDIVLPTMDGIEMAKKIKEAGVKSLAMFLTNLSDPEHIGRALETTASDYIVKADVRIDTIVDRVKSKLGL